MLDDMVGYTDWSEISQFEMKRADDDMIRWECNHYLHGLGGMLIRQYEKLVKRADESRFEYF